MDTCISTPLYTYCSIDQTVQTLQNVYNLHQSLIVSAAYDTLTYTCTSEREVQIISEHERVNTYLEEPEIERHITMSQTKVEIRV